MGFATPAITKSKAALAFVKTLQQQQPEVYQAEFQYLDDILVMYALFQEDEAAVREASRPL